MIYAGFWRRFAAMIIDSIIMIIPSMILGLAFPYVGWVVVGFLYKPFFESSAALGTPGKVFMGLQVTDLEGNRLTFKTSLIRYIGSILSGAILCLGHLFNLFTAKRQTLHDMIANTVVIMKEGNADVNWFQVWLSEFKRVFNIAENAIENVTASATAPRSEASLSTLDTLHKLYQQGAISEAEYNAKKEEILKKI